MNKSVAHNVYRISASSNDTGINARKNQAAILQAYGALKQRNIAVSWGVSDAKVSRAKDEFIPEVARFLAACGLMVVPEDMVVMDQRQVDALVHLAQQLNRGPVDER